MTEQRHKVNLGKGGVASLVVDSPILKFWKGIDVYYDLSKCEREYRQEVFKQLGKIVGRKLKGRDIHFHISFPIIEI